MNDEAALVEAIRAGYRDVCRRVREAAARVGRPAAQVTVVAVSKKHPPAVLDAAYAAGIRHVGENYAQEMRAKLGAVTHADRLHWHFIGQLQRNKVKYLVARAALIHALDSLQVAREIDRRMARAVADGETQKSVQPVLVAVNLAGESQKSGVAENELAEFLSGLRDLAHVRCDGFMSMPPLAQHPEESRGYFRALAGLRARLRSPERPYPELSIGTTGDFDVAVEEGATIVRVGTAIFGERPA